MGRLGDSFTREVGKNTGKFVSNLIFGDKHSTPYRRVDNGRSEAAKIRAAAIESKAMADIQKQKNDDLNILDGAVLENVDIVLQTPIPQEETELVKLMSMWAAQLSGSNWDFDSEEGKIRNQFPDALMEKYKQCTILIKAISPNNAMMQYFDNVLADAKKRRLKARIKPYGAILLFFSLGIVCFVIVGIASLFE